MEAAVWCMFGILWCNGALIQQCSSISILPLTLCTHRNRRSFLESHKSSTYSNFPRELHHGDQGTIGQISHFIMEYCVNETSTDLASRIFHSSDPPNRPHIATVLSTIRDTGYRTLIGFPRKRAKMAVSNKYRLKKITLTSQWPWWWSWKSVVWTWPW